MYITVRLHLEKEALSGEILVVLERIWNIGGAACPRVQQAGAPRYYGKEVLSDPKLSKVQAFIFRSVW